MCVREGKRGLSASLAWDSQRPRTLLPTQSGAKHRSKGAANGQRAHRHESSGQCLGRLVHRSAAVRSVWRCEPAGRAAGSQRQSTRMDPCARSSPQAYAVLSTGPTTSLGHAQTMARHPYFHGQRGASTKDPRRKRICCEIGTQRVPMVLHLAHAPMS